MALIDGLVHLWPMDETSGDLLEDVVGDLGFGTVVASPISDTIVDSATGFGKARNVAAPINGAYLNLYTGVSDGGTYELTTWTLSVRYQHNAQAAAHGNWPNLWFVGLWPDPNYLETYFIASTNSVGMNFADNTGLEYTPASVAPTADVDDGNWHRVTVTNDGTTVKLYWDAQLVQSVVISNPVKLLLKSTNAFIGVWGDADSVDPYPAGALDDAAIWNRALTSTEISSTQYQAQPLGTYIPDPAATFTGQLKHYWPLDEDTGATVADVIGGLVSTVVNDNADTIVEAGKFSRARHLMLGGPTFRRYIQLYTGVPDITDKLTQWSISLWFYLEPTASDRRIIAFNGYDAGFQDLQIIEVLIDGVGSNLLTIGLYGPSPTWATIAEGNYTVAEDIRGQERLLVVSCDGTYTSTYLDNKVLGVLSGAIQLGIKGNTRVGGSYNTTTGSFNGWVDDIAVYETALTATDVSILWNDGTGVTAGSVNFISPNEFVEVAEVLDAVFGADYRYTNHVYDMARALDANKTFWTQTVSLTDTVNALLQHKPAFVLTLAEAAQAGGATQFAYELSLLERATAQDLRFGQYTVQLVEALRATPTLRAFLTELIDEEIEVEGELRYEDALILLDALFAQIHTSSKITTTRTDFTNALDQFTSAVPAEVWETIEAEQVTSVSAALNLIDRMQVQTARAAAFAVSRVDFLRAQLTDRLALQGDLLDVAEFLTDTTFFDSIILREILTAQTERTASFSLNRLDSIRAQLLARAGISDSLTDEIDADVAFISAFKLVLRDAVTGSTPLQGGFTLERTDTARARTLSRISFASLLLDSVAAGTEFSFLDVLHLKDVLEAQTGYESVVTSSLILALLARDFAQHAETQLTTEEILADQGFQLEVTKIIALYDELQASLESSQTLTIMVSDTLEGQAGDAVEVLGKYFAEPQDVLSAWVLFRLGEEASTGWVMNTEGDMPLSEYVGYDFNSMCRVGDTYLGARDEGLYVLEGDTDDGEPIEAAVRTMMLDFGSPVMKRVRNAYIGYTSDGRLLLKVKVADGGELKEQWYEAQQLQADAPREQMIRVGRGLRSRYWQFELVNVDGSNFEVMNLELHPVYLNRRV